jgi:ribosome recycling factor
MVAGVRTGTISIGFSGWTAKGVLPRSDLGQQGDRILITPFDKSVIPAIVRALNEARLNAYAFNPSTVSVSVPPISEEERAEIARHVKKLGEDATVAIRAIRQEARKRIEVSGRGSLRSVREATDAAVAEIDSPVRAGEVVR